LGDQFHGLNVLLVFYVLFDYGQWCAADRGDKVTIRPERWQSSLERWEFLTKQAGTSAFHQLDQRVDTELRVNANQDMHMVGHYFDFEQVAFVFVRHFAQDYFEAIIYATEQNLAPIFRTPNHMVLTGVGDVIV
jgi:hypothetical protein